MKIQKGSLLAGAILGCLSGLLIAPDRTEENKRGGLAAAGEYAKWGVTEKDWQQNRILVEQARRGEFILIYEKPVVKKLIAYDTREVAAKAALKRGAEYQQVFARFGLTSEISARLQRHLAKIHLASLEAEVAIQQVMDARLNYQEQLEKLLGEAAYHRYRQYELRKPAILEYEKLHQLAANEGRPLDAVGQEVIISLIQEVEAYTQSFWHGPFDYLPIGAFGADNVRAKIATERQELAKKVRQLLEKAAEQQLPEGVRAAISKYYSNAMDRMQVAIENVGTRPRLPTHPSAISANPRLRKGTNGFRF